MVNGRLGLRRTLYTRSDSLHAWVTKCILGAYDRVFVDTAARLLRSRLTGDDPSYMVTCLVLLFSLLTRRNLRAVSAHSGQSFVHSSTERH